MDLLARFFSIILESTKMPEEQRRIVLVQVCKDKHDVQRCSNYSDIHNNSKNIGKNC